MFNCNYFNKATGDYYYSSLMLITKPVFGFFSFVLRYLLERFGAVHDLIVLGQFPQQQAVLDRAGGQNVSQVRHVEDRLFLLLLAQLLLLPVEHLIVQPDVLFLGTSQPVVLCTLCVQRSRNRLDDLITNGWTDTHDAPLPMCATNAQLIFSTTFSQTIRFAFADLSDGPGRYASTGTLTVMTFSFARWPLPITVWRLKTLRSHFFSERGQRSSWYRWSTSCSRGVRFVMTDVGLTNRASDNAITSRLSSRVVGRSRPIVAWKGGSEGVRVCMYVYENAKERNSTPSPFDRRHSVCRASTSLHFYVAAPCLPGYLLYVTLSTGYSPWLADVRKGCGIICADSLSSF